MKLLLLVLLGMTQVGWGQDTKPPFNSCGCDAGYHLEGACVVIDDRIMAKCVRDGVRPIKPEPVDVPAISVCKVKVAGNEVCPGEVNDLNRSVEGFRKYGAMGYRWTCADKTRILLKSEDGKQWCHKVMP